MLGEIEEFLDSGTIDEEGCQNILGKVSRLDALGTCVCPDLCARGIQVMKRLAFLPQAEGLCDSIFGILERAWKRGLKLEERPSRGPDEERLFAPQKFLDGWTADLANVLPGALPAYLRLLRFEGIHQASAHVDTALEKFVERAANLSDKQADIVGDSLSALVSDVLMSLPDEAKCVAVSHVLEAAKLIDIAVRMDAKLCLADELSPVRRAVIQLPILLQTLYVAPKADDREDSIHESLNEAYIVLNKLHRQRPTDRVLLKGPLSVLMPWLGGWPRRLERKNGKGWRVIAREGRVGKVGGAVVDFCPQYGGVHIQLDNSVEWHHKISDGVALKVVGEEGDRIVRDVNLAFQTPKGKQIVCRGRALRGWMYEEDYEVSSSSAGIVFRLLDAPADLCREIDQLTVRSGLELVAGIPRQADPAMAETAPQEVASDIVPPQPDASDDLAKRDDPQFIGKPTGDS
jgi:hypothetical protein